MVVRREELAAGPEPFAVPPGVELVATPGPRHEVVHFALRNWKFVFGASLVLFLLLVAIFGPMLTAHKPLEFTAPTDLRPSSDY